jgi:integrase
VTTLKEFAQSPVRAVSVHGVSRAQLGDLNPVAIRSVATENGYRSAVNQYHQWLAAYRLSPREAQTIGMLLEFLDEYAEAHAQASVDHMRLALQKCYSVKLGHVESGLPQIVRGRAYHFRELERILERQTRRNQLSVLLCIDAGLRAHECLTLFPRDCGEPSSYREWSKERFTGRKDYQVFLVKGKGGLVREVAVSLPIAEAVNQTRRPEPRMVTDRGINHESYFDLAGGQALSASFTSASQKALGWSLGLHGLRHAFAQERLQVLISILGSERALLVLSQELAHFREAVSLQYLRGR